MKLVYAKIHGTGWNSLKAEGPKTRAKSRAVMRYTAGRVVIANYTNSARRKGNDKIDMYQPNHYRKSFKSN